MEDLILTIDRQIVYIDMNEVKEVTAIGCP